MTDTKKDATKKAWATVTIANDDFVLLFVVALVRLIVIPRIFILFKVVMSFFLIPSKVKILSNVNIYYLGFQIFMFIALYQINPSYYSFFYSINTRYRFIIALLFISVLVARARSDVRTQGRLHVLYCLGFSII